MKTKIGIGLAFASLGLSTVTQAVDEIGISFEKKELSDVFFSEGASFGDIDGDGTNDIVSGPWIYFGPNYTAKTKAAFYEPKPFKKAGYSDNFFSFLHDFDEDGDSDILVLGFPGKDASWFENPGAGRKWDAHWVRHKVLEPVDNESPEFADITGDGKPEIICSQNGVLGFAEPNGKAPWIFRKISPEKSTGARFTHGLGIGDVNGDGKMDLLEKTSWWEQPASLEGDPLWKRHLFSFSGPGGADMFAYDFDGDGDNDILSSQAAHGYGLAWFEQVVKENGKKSFEKHMIMGQQPSENPYGLVFSQLHAIALADVDGDGIKDIVTGKRHWAHNGHDPEGNGAAVLYWFRAVREKEGPNRGKLSFIPYQIDNDSGVGTDVVAKDINGDGLVDVLVGNKKGTFIHLQSRKKGKSAGAIPKVPVRKEFVETGLSPSDAIKQMSLPEGFRIDLIASEPDVKQPIAMAIDERGRLWIAEAHSYPVREPEGEGKDRILIFADEDGDGKFETRKVFMEGINLVSGIEVGFGGVWVGAAPNLLFIPDKNHDDVPDGKPQILLDGWGYEDTHETLNSFVWGPDGWLYGCHGVFTHSKVGKPGTPDEARTPLNAGVWRYHPVRHEFEVFAHGTSNPWGLDFDENGEAFVTACVIPHLYHIIPGGRYQRQGGKHFNPHTYDDIKTIADHLHYAGNIRDNAHWGGKTPIAPTDTLTLGGGHAHCGLSIYQGNQFPEQYRGKFLFTNLHGHGIISDYTVPNGSGFTGKHGADFLHGNDRWFMPIDMQYGPDGSLFVIDWYDRQNCHKRDDEIWDRSNGRIYRVSYGKTFRLTLKNRKADVYVGTPWFSKKLSGFSKAEKNVLIKYQQQDTDDWFSHSSRRLLHERNAKGVLDNGKVISELNDQVERAGNTGSKLRSLWTLFTIGALDDDKLVGHLNSSESEIRKWSVRLLGDDKKVSESGIKKCKELAKTDPSSIVRRELASVLQRIPNAQRWDIAANLLAHGEDAKDHNIPYLLWYGVEPLVLDDPTRALQLAEESKIPMVTQFIYRRLAHEEEGRETLFSMIGKQKANPAKSKLVLNEISQALKDRVSAPVPKGWDGAFVVLSKLKDPQIQQQLQSLTIKFGDKRMLPQLRKIMLNQSASLPARQGALNALVAAKDTGSVDAFQSLLAGPETVIRSGAIMALAGFSDAKTPGVLLGIFDKLTPAEQANAVTVLAGNQLYATSLLQALANGMIPRKAISAFGVRQIRSLKDEKLDALLSEYWGKISETSGDKKAEITKYKSYLTPKFLATANKGHGRTLFNQACFACHKLFGEGNEIGPDITGGNRRDLSFLLENIINPGAVIGADYQLTSFTLKDGQILLGMVRGDNENAVRIALPGGTEQLVSKAKIAKREKLELSMMPEGILAPMSKEQVRDLVAYLQSPMQVAAVEPGEISYEGESLKVVKAAGKARPQSMKNFKGSAWGGDSHLWWTGASPGDELDLEFSVPDEGDYEVSAALTKAVDYGIFSLSLDGKVVLLMEVDLFNKAVVNTGKIPLGNHKLTKGTHILNVKVTGSNPAAVHRHMFGIDYLKLVKK